MPVRISRKCNKGVASHRPSFRVDIFRRIIQQKPRSILHIRTARIRIWVQTFFDTIFYCFFLKYYKLFYKLFYSLFYLILTKFLQWIFWGFLCNYKKTVLVSKIMKFFCQSVKLKFAGKWKEIIGF